MTVEWHGIAIHKRIEAITKKDEKATAERIAASARRRCPVGKWEKGITKRGSRATSWTARKPGSLKNSIRVNESLYHDGGYLVMAGTDDIFYASFVEMGVPAHNIPKKPFLRGAAKAEKARFFRKLKRDLAKL